jgi:predicted enzyme related to lactoylglutathione lyase
MPSNAGDFVWYELMTSDVAAASAFYAKVIGWNVADSGMPGMTYLLAKVGDRMVGGMMGFPPEVSNVPPNWSGYVFAPDVDGTAEKLVAAGGAIHRAPGDIPGVGRFAVVADPQGAIFMLFRGDGEPAPDLAYMTPGTVGWHELHAKDGAAVFPFYEGLFGWKKDTAIEMGGEMGTYQLFATSGDMAVGGMMTDTRGPVAYWLYYFTVEDIDAALDRVTGAGGTPVMGPMEVPGGAWVLVATDPQGAYFALVGMRKKG